MKKILAILFLSLTLTSYSNKESGMSDEEISSTLRDIEFVTNKYINYDKEAKVDLLNIVYKDKKYRPKLKTSNKEELLAYLKEHKGSDYKLNWLYENFDKLTDIEQRLVGNDTDTGEFIYNSYKNNTDFKLFDGESLDLNRKTPFFLQWDNRWAYEPLADSSIAIAGCGPTSMAMVIRRFVDDKEINPKTIADHAHEYMTENGIAWEFFKDEGAKFGLNVFEISVDEELMKENLKNGPLLVSVTPGYFTTSGHIIVIDSYDDGKFIINDPNSIKNTKIAWSFDDISGQLLKIWAISK